MKHRSGMVNIYCPQICFWFLSYPQNTRNNHESQLQHWGLPTSDCKIWAY